MLHWRGIKEEADKYKEDGIMIRRRGRNLIFFLWLGDKIRRGGISQGARGGCGGKRSRMQKKRRIFFGLGLSLYCVR